ncbi:MAG: ATP-binding cassette domain-containing protein [Clostridiaceae bacterium]
MNISITNLEKYYGKRKVISDFTTSFNIDQGNIYGLVGPNGAGKTTFLKVLTGLLEYKGGEIKLDSNIDGEYQNWSRKYIAFVSAGERGMRYKNTVYDNILYYGALKGSNPSVIKQNINTFSNVLNFENFLNKRVENLSTGEKKKAAILCGICSGMKVLILDEPSNGLDIDSSQDLLKIILNLVEQTNITIIISSHDVDFLSSIVKKYIFIFNGKNVLERDEKMSTEELRETYFKLKERYGSNEK